MGQKPGVEKSAGKCKICLNDQNNIKHTFEENMFGTGEKFEYLECTQCGCLQLINVPDDLTPYYPRKYSNFKSVQYRAQGRIAKYLKKKKSEYLLGINKNIPGFLMKLITEPGFVIKLKPANIGLKDKILDLGAGNGDRLLRLSYRGFINLVGIDPFIDTDIKFEHGLCIRKMGLDDLRETFDFVMLNHSFEHMPNPLEILKKLNRLVVINHYILIRIPVANSFAWKNYGENWIALDPPRHIFLHTRKSIKILAEKAGFQLAKAVDDSLMFQFIGSEQLIRGIKSRDNNSYYVDQNKSVFSKKDIKQFKQKAKYLNKRGEGDTSCFYLIKKKNIKNVIDNSGL